MINDNLEMLLDEIKRFSEEQDNIFAIPHDEGSFLHMLILWGKPGRILELGTSSGYSTIWLAAAAASYSGQVETVEYDPSKIKLATDNFAKAGLSEVISVHQADANEYLKDMDGNLDFVFMDTEKEEYLYQFKLLFPNLNKGAIVAADNAVDLADHMGDYLDYVKNLEGVSSVTVPIGNGLELTMRL